MWLQTPQAKHIALHSNMIGSDKLTSSLHTTLGACNRNNEIHKKNLIQFFTMYIFYQINIFSTDFWAEVINKDYMM